MQEQRDEGRETWIDLFICLSMYLSIYLPICLSICLSIYLCIYLSTDLYEFDNQANDADEAWVAWSLRPFPKNLGAKNCSCMAGLVLATFAKNGLAANYADKAWLAWSLLP